MTRPATEILADLAAVSDRQAQLQRELARALAVAAEAPAHPAPAPAEYLTTAEAAELIGASTRILELRRARGSRPAFVTVGRSVRYAKAELMAWLDDRPIPPGCGSVAEPT